MFSSFPNFFPVANFFSKKRFSACIEPNQFLGKNSSIGVLVFKFSPKTFSAYIEPNQFLEKK
jgi:hypothetical protein